MKKSIGILVAASLAFFSFGAFAAHKQDIAIGGDHILFKKEGKVISRGDNSSGAMGVPSLINSSGYGVAGVGIVDSLNNVVDVAAGGLGSLFLTGDGKVYFAGLLPTKVKVFSPMLIEGIPPIVDVERGPYYSFMIDANGNVYFMSFFEKNLTPRLLTGLPPIDQISVGFRHFLMLSKAGEVFVVSETNTYGEAGLGDINPVLTPTKIPSLSNIVKVAAGATHSLALDKDGNIFAWGRNNYGQLGNGLMQEINATPFKVSALSNVVDIEAGDSFSMALVGGKVYLWGWHNYIGGGQGYLYQANPLPLVVFSNALEIMAGGDNAFVKDSDGTLYAWSDNGSFEIDNSNVPEYHEVAKVVLPEIKSQYEQGYAAGYAAALEISTTQTLVAAETVQECPIQEPIVQTVEVPVIQTETVIQTVEVPVIQVVTETIIQYVDRIVEVVKEVVNTVYVYLTPSTTVNNKVHDDNGHGNDIGKFDTSNPGKSKR